MVVEKLSFFSRSSKFQGQTENIVGKNGVIIKNKGNIHYIGFNVTGSNDGT